MKQSVVLLLESCGVRIFSHIKIFQKWLKVQGRFAKDFSKWKVYTIDIIKVLFSEM